MEETFVISQTVCDPIVWEFNDIETCWQAKIGSYTLAWGDVDNVYAIYWQASKHGGQPGEPLFSWEVRVTANDNPHSKGWWIVSMDKARTPRKAQKAGEFVAKEWIRGDSHLWNEGGDDDKTPLENGGDHDIRTSVAAAVRSESTGIFDDAC